MWNSAPELWGRTNCYWDALKSFWFSLEKFLCSVFFIVAHSCVTMLILILNKSPDRVLRSA